MAAPPVLCPFSKEDFLAFWVRRGLADITRTLPRLIYAFEKNFTA